jgi:hypothetical protein
VSVAVLTAIGSLGIGALVGAAVAHILRERADKNREERELHGLLRLLQDDVVRNLKVSALFSKHPEYMVTNSYGRMRIGTWQQVRVRLAQLMREQDFETLLDYYAAVETFLSLQQTYREVHSTTSADGARRRQEALDYLVEHVQPQQTHALRAIRTSVASSKVPYPWPMQRATQT